MDANQIQAIKRRYDIVGNCDGLNRAIDIALQVAKTDLSVLILGESGVGKDVLPRIMHEASLRSGRPYFPINCGSIPEGTIDSELFGHEKGAFTGAIGEHKGYFGMADGGTLFLDEVGELPLSTQARLLRVLESGEYIRVGGSQVMKTNVRIIAATNVNIQEAIRKGKFREDLYYRLCGTSIKMPPLRERGEDIVKLFKKFAMEFSQRYSMPEYIRLTPEAEEVVKRYKWPGNIRQLRNITEEMSILQGDNRVITPEILGEYDIFPNIDEDGALVMVSSAQQAHTYAEDREAIYTMFTALHQEISALRAEVEALKKGGSHAAQGHSLHSLDLVQHPAAQTPEPENAYAEEYVETLSFDDYEKQNILKALARNNGNRKSAAIELGISERTFYRKLDKYGISR